MVHLIIYVHIMFSETGSFAHLSLQQDAFWLHGWTEGEKTECSFLHLMHRMFQKFRNISGLTPQMVFIPKVVCCRSPGTLSI